MPKMKTHKGAARRFGKTGTGKIKVRHSHNGHIKTKKSSKARQLASRKTGIASTGHQEIIRLLH